MGNLCASAGSGPKSAAQEEHDEKYLSDKPVTEKETLCVATRTPAVRTREQQQGEGEEGEERAEGGEGVQAAEEGAGQGPRKEEEEEGQGQGQGQGQERMMNVCVCRCQGWRRHNEDTYLVFEKRDGVVTLNETGPVGGAEEPPPPPSGEGGGDAAVGAPGSPATPKRVSTPRSPRLSALMHSATRSSPRFGSPRRKSAAAATPRPASPRAGTTAAREVTYLLVGVFDGHGGDEAALFTRTHLPSVLEPLLVSSGWDYESAFRQCMFAMDELLVPVAKHSGTTAIICLLHGDVVVASNVGDSRAFLCRGGRQQPLSIDHKPQKQSERRRILRAGAKLDELSAGHARVHSPSSDMSLAIARTLGDFEFKSIPGRLPEEQPVSCVPDVKTVNQHMDDDYVFLASDGLWDVFDNHEVVTYMEHVWPQCDNSLVTGVEALVNRCMRLGSNDNITIALVDLRGTRNRQRFRPTGKSRRSLSNTDREISGDPQPTTTGAAPTDPESTKEGSTQEATATAPTPTATPTATESPEARGDDAAGVPLVDEGPAKETHDAALSVCSSERTSSVPADTSLLLHSTTPSRHAQSGSSSPPPQESASRGLDT